VPDEIRTPHPRHRHDRWPDRLAGRAVTSVDTYGKHLFLRFEGDLVIHSHLGMSGAWAVYPSGRRWGRSPSRAWLVLRAGTTEIVEFDGPLLELLTEGRAGLRPASRPGSPYWAGPASSGCFDQRLAALGPDVLAAEFDTRRFLARIRGDDPTRPVGDALLDQRNVAGIGNIWKAEGCWEAAIDPCRAVGGVSDAELTAIIEGIRPRMRRSALEGPRTIDPRVYRRAGQPCPRCGGRIDSQGQGDANRTTYWCPGCQH
jgi:endonuclease VIII